MSNDENAQVVCPNCGAGFSVEEPRCPYCGALNPAGAEKAYMETLDDIRQNTDDLDDAAQEGFNDTLRSNAKRTIALIVIAVAVLASLFFISNCTERQDEQRALEEFQAREAFRTKHFAEFDRLYEAGDDDALSAYVWSQLDDPGFDALFSWEHVDYLRVHDDWEAMQVASRDFRAGEGDLEEYTWAVMAAMRLAQLEQDDSSSSKLDEKEEQRAAAYRSDAWQFLEDTLRMNRSEIASFADAAKDADGYIQEEKLKQNLEPLLKQLGTIN